VHDNHSRPVLIVSSSHQHQAVADYNRDASTGRGINPRLQPAPVKSRPPPAVVAMTDENDYNCLNLLRAASGTVEYHGSVPWQREARFVQAAGDEIDGDQRLRESGAKRRGTSAEHRWELVQRCSPTTVHSQLPDVHVGVYRSRPQSGTLLMRHVDSEHDQLLQQATTLPRAQWRQTARGETAADSIRYHPETVSAPSVNSLKSRLDKHWMSHRRRSRGGGRGIGPPTFMTGG